MKPTTMYCTLVLLLVLCSSVSGILNWPALEEIQNARMISAQKCGADSHGEERVRYFISSVISTLQRKNFTSSLDSKEDDEFLNCTLRGLEYDEWTLKEVADVEKKITIGYIEIIKMLYENETTFNAEFQKECPEISKAVDSILELREEDQTKRLKCLSQLINTKLPDFKSRESIAIAECSNQFSIPLEIATNIIYNGFFFSRRNEQGLDFLNCFMRLTGYYNHINTRDEGWFKKVQEHIGDNPQRPKKLIWSGYADGQKLIKSDFANLVGHFSPKKKSGIRVLQGTEVSRICSKEENIASVDAFDLFFNDVYPVNKKEECAFDCFVYRSDIDLINHKSYSLQFDVLFPPQNGLKKCYNKVDMSHTKKGTFCTEALKFFKCITDNLSEGIEKAQTEISRELIILNSSASKARVNPDVGAALLHGNLVPLHLNEKYFIMTYLLKRGFLSLDGSMNWERYTALRELLRQEVINIDVVKGECQEKSKIVEEVMTPETVYDLYSCITEAENKKEAGSSDPKNKIIRMETGAIKLCQKEHKVDVLSMMIYGLFPTTLKEMEFAECFMSRTRYMFINKDVNWEYYDHSMDQLKYAEVDKMKEDTADCRKVVEAKPSKFQFLVAFSLLFSKRMEVSQGKQDFNKDKIARAEIVCLRETNTNDSVSNCNGFYFCFMKRIGFMFHNGEINLPYLKYFLQTATGDISIMNNIGDECSRLLKLDESFKKEDEKCNYAAELYHHCLIPFAGLLQPGSSGTLEQPVH